MGVLRGGALIAAAPFVKILDIGARLTRIVAFFFGTVGAEPAFPVPVVAGFLAPTAPAVTIQHEAPPP